MFDIFVFLFENFFHADACPDAEQLAVRLTAAGFEDEEIHEALQWLEGLQVDPSGELPEVFAQSRSIRCYSEDEQARFNTECRGFLAFLENSGVLDPPTRECIIERTLALPDRLVTLSKLKIIVLMVLWKQHQCTDTLILEELLCADPALLRH